MMNNRINLLLYCNSKNALILTLVDPPPCVKLNRFLEKTDAKWKTVCISIIEKKNNSTTKSVFELTCTIEFHEYIDTLAIAVYRYPTRKYEKLLNVGKIHKNSVTFVRLYKIVPFEN